jgi:Txe/YoeB family toxin of Txe-Axe toxin-antitoxin module
MDIKPLREDLRNFIKDHNLVKKWEKAKYLFENNIRHPSLGVELLEPRWRGIYSFRLNKKYRALFFITNGKDEVLQIAKHYKRY